MQQPAPTGGGLVLTGVTMELAGTPGPATVVAGAALALSGEGVRVWAPGAAVVAVPWADLRDARCGEPGLLADGSRAVAVSALVGGRLVRWLVPAPQMPPERALAIDHLLGARSGRSGTVADGFVPPGAAGTAGAAGARVRSRVVALLWAVVALLVLAGAAILGAGLTSSTTHRSSGAGGDPALATSVNLTRADLPAGWTVSATSDGPLSGFLHPAGSHGASIVSTTGAQRAIARQYEQCMGIPASADLVMGVTAPTPSAHASSPAFASPAGSSPMQVGSVTDVYRSGADVRRGAGQIAAPKFGQCFGAAVAKDFRYSAKGSSTGSAVTYGAPTVDRLSLPARSGVRAAGVDVGLPLTISGATVTVQLGFVFVVGGRVESTMVSFSEGPGFPTSLSSRLAGVLEARVSKVGATRSVSRAAS